jgi:type II secretory pathway component PulM
MPAYVLGAGKRLVGVWVRFWTPAINHRRKKRLYLVNQALCVVNWVNW